MPRTLPGVEISISDKSQVIQQTANSVIFAQVIEAAKGPTEPTLISTSNDLTKYFGTYEELTTLNGKNTYISAVQCLKNGTGLYLSNVAPGAKYGGMKIYGNTVIPYTAGNGPSSNTSYTFENETHVVSGTFSSSPLSLTLPSSPILEKSVIIKYKKTTGTPSTFVLNGVGADYVALNVLTVTGGNVNGTVRVDTVDVDGKILTYTVLTTGSGYSVATGLTVTGGAGTGATFNVTSISNSVTTWYTEVDDGLTSTGHFSSNNGDINSTTATVTYASGICSLTFLNGRTPDVGSTVYAYAGPLFVVLAYSSKTWSSNYGIKIANKSDINNNATVPGQNSFDIQEYVLGTSTQLTSYTVSRDSEKIDGFGNRIFIEDIVSSKSTNFRVFSNDLIDSTLLPYAPSAVTYLLGATDGTTPMPSDVVTSLNAFIAPNINADIYLTAGYIDKTIIDAIDTIINTKFKFAFGDCGGTSDASSDVVTWATTSAGLNNTSYMRWAFYTPKGHISYNGKTVSCPASAIVANNYAQYCVANGKKFMPPAGVERGSVNVTRLNRYYTDANCLDLHEAEVNVIKNIPGYGDVIFSDFTSQRLLSSTSYINSVLTLNDMLYTFNSYLLTINFKLLNDLTVLELRTLIDGYLRRLSQQDGTIEPQYTIQTTMDKDQRTIYANVIFVFQGLVQKINLTLTYTSNAMYSQIANG